MLTAVEDFVSGRDDLRLAIVPAFFGLGVIWETDGPHADALARLLDPWDRNPLVQRMEDNRVLHLANTHVQMILAQEAQQRVADQDLQLQRQQQILSAMRASRVLRAAALVLRLRGSEPVFSERELRRAMS